MTGTSLLTYWYYHLPNFILAALMYTLLGRVAARPDRRAELCELHLAVLLPHHRSGRRCGRDRDAEGDARPVVVWLFGVVWLFWLRVGLLITIR